jgi:tripartite-type tricarboxylate transporter receptor subunit TctC
MTLPRLLLAALALLVLPLDAAPAQEWPAHPLRIIVPFPAGGSADAQARVIADELGRALGQPVIVENKPGAGGNLAAAAAAHAAPDGSTLFLATTGTHASNVSLYKNLPFDPAKDFAPLTLVTLNPQAIVAGGKYEGLDLKGLIDKLKASGAAANFGSSGIGSATHIAGDLFNRATGAALVHVPYRGQGPALNDLLGGRLDVMFPLAADVFSFVKSRKLTAFERAPRQIAARRPDHRGARAAEAAAVADLDRALHRRRLARAGRRAAQPRAGAHHRGAGVRGAARGRRLRGACVEPGRAARLRGRRDRQMGRDHPRPRRPPGVSRAP